MANGKNKEYKSNNSRQCNQVCKSAIEGGMRAKKLKDINYYSYYSEIDLGDQPHPNSALSVPNSNQVQNPKNEQTQQCPVCHTPTNISTETLANEVACKWYDTSRDFEMRGKCDRCIRHELIFGYFWPRRARTNLEHKNTLNAEALIRTLGHCVDADSDFTDDDTLDYIGVQMTQMWMDKKSIFEVIM